ncbi:hypothetical protein [Streptomyces sp. NBC_00212]|uniref:hypothetical protein n=1 Tax=Streptomyces sp. NBC_00212 TaxID=2975684 RepID=UPI00324676A1
MTTSIERETVQPTSWQAMPLPAPVPPHAVRNVPEGGFEAPRAVVTVRLALTRDQLAAAATISASYLDDADCSPDNWPVEFTQFMVDMTVTQVSALELDLGADSMVEMSDSGHRDPDVRDFTQGVYRAIDRAYPPAPAAVVLSGNPQASRVRCACCAWSDGSEMEQALAHGFSHYEQTHGRTE